jgi:hypothetical protein
MGRSSDGKILNSGSGRMTLQGDVFMNVFFIPVQNMEIWRAPFLCKDM